MAAELTRMLSPAIPADSAEKTAELTGLSGRVLALTEGAGATCRPLSARWITDAWVAETCRVWSAYLGHPVTEAEAVEMLINVRNVAMAMLAATEPEGDQEP